MSEKLKVNDEEYKFRKFKLSAGLWTTHAITLISLVITIVILIILAGVAVNLSLGENGLFRRAKEARDKYLTAEEKEQQQLNELYAYLSEKDLPENTKDTEAGTLVKIPNSWLTVLPNYVSDVDGSIVKETKTASTVYAVADGKGNTIPVPVGFWYVGGTEETGVVISDREEDSYVKNKRDMTPHEDSIKLIGNQFVWIPCTINNYTMVTTFKNASGANAWGINWDGQTNAAEEVQIRKYGGFYIGRYEAGMSQATFGTNDNIVDKEAAINTKTINGLTGQCDLFLKGNASSDSKPTSKAGEIPWSRVDYLTAIEMSKRMYTSSSSVISGLMTGTMWDTIMKFISEDPDYNDLRSTPWGNYSNSNLTNCTGKYCVLDQYGNSSAWQENTVGTNKPNANAKYTLLSTGSTEQVKKKNIYDIAGNLSEWTDEVAYFSNINATYAGWWTRIARGASYADDYNTWPVCYRIGVYSISTLFTLGFRVALFLK